MIIALIIFISVALSTFISELRREKRKYLTTVCYEIDNVRLEEHKAVTARSKLHAIELARIYFLDDKERENHYGNRFYPVNILDVWAVEI